MARWDAGAASAALIFASIIGGVVGQTHQTRISLSAAMLARDVVCGAVYQNRMLAPRIRDSTPLALAAALSRSRRCEGNGNVSSS